jgi:hypothetical protein
MSPLILSIAWCWKWCRVNGINDRGAATAGWSTSNRVCSLNGNAERRAMAAGLTDHVWTLKEWITFPAKFC